MAYRIIPRSEWGARFDNGAGTRALPCKETWLHHSVSLAPDLLPPFEDDYAAIRDLEKIGESRFGRGISYTFLVTPAGLIFEGHSIDRIGSHTQYRNTIAAGICLVGNYDTKPPPTPMLDAVGWLLAHGFLSGWWDAVALDGGHRDLKPTACPGRYAYAELENINGRAKAHANGSLPLEDDMTPEQAAALNDVTAKVQDLWYWLQQLTKEDDIANHPKFTAAIRKIVREETAKASGGVDVDALVDAIAARLAD